MSGTADEDRFEPSPGNNCQGNSARGGRVHRCAAEPLYSVSRDLGQAEDVRVCGSHLSWLVGKFAQQGESPVVVARLRKGRA